MQRKAVITIEVLIALIVMFSAIVMTTSSIRTLNLFKLKKEKYEVNYTTVLSLKAMLENRAFEILGGKFIGDINGFEYEISYKPTLSKRTFVLGETEASMGNYGPYNIILYDCILQLLKEDSYSESVFQILKYEKIETNE